MSDPQSNDHLAFPQRNGIYNSRLDLFRHLGIISLYQTDLGGCLDTDHPGQLQVMDLFLKTVAERIQVFGCLGVFRQIGGLGFAHKLRQLCGTDLLQFLLSCQDIHGKLFKVIQIQSVHLVHSSRIFHQLDLMFFQNIHDPADIGLSLGIFIFHSFQLVCASFEKAHNAFPLFFRIKALQLRNYIFQKVSHFSQVFCPDFIQSLL